MANPDYKAALAQEQKELAALEHAQRKIEQDILRRRRRIASLMELVKESDERNQEVFKQLAEGWARYNIEQGLTEDIRKIIRSHGTLGVFKDSIRTELSKLGKSIDNHVNPAGTVNSIVKRLVDKGEVVEESTVLPNSPTIVRWKDQDTALFQAFLDTYTKRKKK